MTFYVTEKAMRPASDKRRCFYCLAPIGDEHKQDCVLVKKKVTVQMKISYEITVPASWEKHQIEFQRNDGSWCADNAISELEEIAEKEGCLCNRAEFEYIGGDSKPFLDE